MAVVTGTNNNDNLLGTNFNDTVKGLGGNDQIDGLDGDDILDGGAGNDTISSGIGNDVLLGGIGLDTLAGGIGNNFLDGGAGIDTMSGGDGDDTYIVDVTGDVIFENAGEGFDRVESKASYTLSAELEDLTLTGTAITGTGNALANTIIGNAGANKLFGLGDDDLLDGGKGADSLTGGVGNDRYVIDNTGDKVFENAGEGTDDVLAYVNYTLAANVERLFLANGAFTATPITVGTGNALDNEIYGNQSANTLDGAGGADTLQGAEGDDVYIVDNAGDNIVEFALEGADTVRASITYDLDATTVEVENLTLTGTAAIDGSGTAIANTITGNSGVNMLTGRGGNDTLNGGAGADILVGGTGDDTFVIDNAGDLVTELAGEGVLDTILSSVTYLMTNANEVEILTLTGTLGISATGNAIANTMTGNGGANTLAGGAGNDTLNGGGGNDVLNGDADNDTLDGGAGTDIMRGGTGDDLYLIFSATGKTIVENAGEGVDTVQSTVTHTLAAELDNLLLLGANLNGTGNALVNTITGTVGNNTLNGMGGADTMIGLAGVDIFIVDDAGDNVDATGGAGGVIRSGVDWNLGVNTLNVDILVLTGAAANGIGNGDDNTITGNAGVNFLSGLGGVDILVADATDILDGGAGNDLASVGFTASVGNANWTSIEGIILTGTGAFNATGDGGNNTLIGNSGRNTLDGGLGDDTYGFTTGDVIIDTGGIDTVRTAMNYTLAAGMENIELDGTGNFNAFGDVNANVITGNSGNNTLDGRGGVDVLSGGSGNDTFIVDNAGVLLIEFGGGGNDTVRTSLTFALGMNFENLVLTGAAAIDGTGNGGGNSLTGNSGNNTLDGAGGVDVMQGGAGNDVFIVDDSNDIATDTSGTDEVRSVVDYVLGRGVENLTLSGTAIFGTGNSFANIIIGTGAANTLDGVTGIDTLIGGDGDDVYIVDAANDVIIENINEGADIVLCTGASYTLSADTDALILGAASGPQQGTGNGLDNTIDGAAGDNFIRGLGGDDILIGEGGVDILQGGAGDDILIGDGLGTIGAAGQDTMTGGEGADAFLFFEATAVPPVENEYDVIMDYKLAEGDTINLFDVLDGGIFSSAVNTLGDFVNVTSSGLLQIDVTGSAGAGDSWVTIALLLGVHSITDVDFVLPP